jgi:hypothetical protein
MLSRYSVGQIDVALLDSFVDVSVIGNGTPEMFVARRLTVFASGEALFGEPHGFHQHIFIRLLNERAIGSITNGLVEGVICLSDSDFITLRNLVLEGDERSPYDRELLSTATGGSHPVYGARRRNSPSDTRRMTASRTGVREVPISSTMRDSSNAAPGSRLSDKIIFRSAS